MSTTEEKIKERIKAEKELKVMRAVKAEQKERKASEKSYKSATVYPETQDALKEEAKGKDAGEVGKKWGDYFKHE